MKHWRVRTRPQLREARARRKADALHSWNTLSHSIESHRIYYFTLGVHRITWLHLTENDSMQLESAVSLWVWRLFISIELSFVCQIERSFLSFFLKHCVVESRGDHLTTSNGFLVKIWKVPMSTLKCWKIHLHDVIGIKRWEKEIDLFAHFIVKRFVFAVYHAKWSYRFLKVFCFHQIRLRVGRSYYRFKVFDGSKRGRFASSDTEFLTPQDSSLT